MALAGDTGAGLITKIYRNNMASANSIPAQPTNLQTFVLFGGGGTNDVLFFWDTGQDAETPTSGLSYQLRIGTTAGGNEIYPGHNLPDGQRLLPQQGPIAPRGLDATYHLLNLEPGTYYWTVQAIDSGFEGSSVLNTAVVTVP